MLKEKKYINLLKKFVYLIYSVIELSVGDYGNPIDSLIKLIEEQNQNDQYIIGK